MMKKRFIRAIILTFVVIAINQTVYIFDMPLQAKYAIATICYIIFSLGLFFYVHRK